MEDQTSLSSSTFMDTKDLTKTIYVYDTRVECVYHPDSLLCLDHPSVDIHCFDDDSDCESPVYSDTIEIPSIDIFLDTTSLSHHIKTYVDIVRQLSWIS